MFVHDKIFRISIVAAVAGFLFGFDTAVISGADQPLQALWRTSNLFHGAFIMSSALWGTVIGALGGNWPCERYGRKGTLVGIGILYLVSALGSALAPEPYTFAVMRFVGGLGVGISSIVVPAYISEIAPAERRGRLVALYQFQLVLGILVAYLSNYVLAQLFGLDWRWMLGAEAVPAAVYLAWVLKVPESPRWLLTHGNESACRAVLADMHYEQVDATVTEIKAMNARFVHGRLLTRRYLWPMVLVVLLAFFNQASGINFVIYFAPRVFALAGLDAGSAMLSTTGVGVVNLVFTMLGLYLIDHSGRRALMFAGSIGYILSLGVVAWAFAMGASGYVVVFFVFLFIASHAVGQGAVIWVFIAEVFPNSVRTKGQSLGCGTHWVGAALITLLTPAVLGRYAPSVLFAFFAVMMVLQLLYVAFLMPETRGRSLEAVASGLAKPQPAMADAP
jgi:sugar porter (SP) family MFS transporter